MACKRNDATAAPARMAVPACRSKPAKPDAAGYQNWQLLAWRMARELLAMEGLLTEPWQRDFYMRMLARKSGHRPVKTMVEARLKPLGNVSSHQWRSSLYNRQRMAINHS